MHFLGSLIRIVMTNCIEKNATFEDFVMGCARGMSACEVPDLCIYRLS